MDVKQHHEQYVQIVLADLITCPVDDGVVQTAHESDGILPGIIRQLVLDICKENGTPVELRAPSMQESHRWSEGWVTNWFVAACPFLPH